MTRRQLQFSAPAIIASVFTSVLLAAPAVAQEGENWPAFRGGDAVPVAGDDERLPLSWSQTENVVWQAAVDGLGWSSPVVWGNQIFLTTVVNEGDVAEPRMGLYFPYGSPQTNNDPRFEAPGPGDLMEREEDNHLWLVQAYDFNTGQQLWSTEVHTGPPDFDRHLKNTYASATPVTDGERLYAYFGNLGVYALSLDGEVLWERRFDAADTRLGWGPAASPALHGNQLFIVNDNDEQSFIVSLDTTTGEERWRADRDEGSNWSTPFVWEHDGRTELITAGSDRVRAYDLDGELLWHFTGLNTISIPQPFSANGLLYVTSGYVGDQVRPVFAIRPGASGDITLADGQTSNEHIVWYQNQAGPYHPTPLVYGDYYFTLLDQGFFTVHDANTGEEMYFTERQVLSQEVRRRVARGTGGFTASPWAYNGKIFVLSEEGDTYVLDPENNFDLVGTNSLGEVAMSSPAIVRGSLIVRTRSSLWRLSAE